jgi:hypothetical protein
MSMIRATRRFRNFSFPVFAFVLLAPSLGALAQDVSGTPNFCDGEVKRLGPPRRGEKIRYPAKAHHVVPAYPPIPDGTTGGGVWIGEILIDTQGRVAVVWTIRDVKSTPPVPLLSKAITDAVAKWQFAPAAVDNVPVPVCRTVSVNVNLKAIRGAK